MSKEISGLRAIAHPIRLQILSLLTGAEMSAAEVARELDLTHANASYHLRVLAEAGELVIAGHEMIRGGNAKRYRHPWDRAPETSNPTDDDRSSSIRAVAQELVRRFDAVQTAHPALISDAEMWVDESVWEQILEYIREAATLIHGNAQPPRTEGTVHVNLTAVAFRMGEDR